MGLYTQKRGGQIFKGARSRRRFASPRRIRVKISTSSTAGAKMDVWTRSARRSTSASSAGSNTVCLVTPRRPPSEARRQLFACVLDGRAFLRPDPILLYAGGRKHSAPSFVFVKNVFSVAAHRSDRPERPGSGDAPGPPARRIPATQRRLSHPRREASE